MPSGAVAAITMRARPHRVGERMLPQGCTGGGDRERTGLYGGHLERAFGGPGGGGTPTRPKVRA